MYKRISAVMFPVVTLLLIGSIVWGYQQMQAKEAVVLQAENQYQRSFHDLTFHVDRLQNELAQTLAVHSASQGMHRKGLANVWKLTSEAQNEMNQLPLSAVSFEKTEDFLSRISNFAYRASIRDMTKEPLSDEEMKTLKALYANSQQISSDLQKVQHKVLSDGLKWMDVQAITTSAKQTGKGTNSIVDGFQDVDNKIKAYQEIKWGSAVDGIFTKRTLKLLEGPTMTEQEIKQKAAKLMRPHEMKELTLQKNGNKPEYQSYTVRAAHQDGNGEIAIDFTKQGVVMSYMDSRPLGKKVLSRDDALASANHFIKRHEFEQLKPVRFQSEGSIEVITFAPVKEQVLMYPMQLKLRVALDTGDVVGVQATEYIFGGLDMNKVNLKPKITMQKAREHVNPNLKISYDRLVVIKNELSHAVLCYEFGGTIDKQAYRIYINAESGLEEAVEIVTAASNAV